MMDTMNVADTDNTAATLHGDSCL